MAQTNRTFRIFVSSTFSDLKAERNALQREVFPKLRELCLQHGCRFQAIDLRWGVSEEAGHDQRTMQICLDEIARCQRTTPRPNFIVLLGQRYGWRPLPAEIPADEFEALLRSLPSEPRERERRSTLLARWYRRDDNAVPPVYCVQPREGAFRDLAVWEPIEHRVRATLLEALDRVALPDEARLKYVASATEQEIVRGALAAADAPQHVLCCFRSIRELPADGRAKDFIDLDEHGNPDRLAGSQLARLKERLRGFPRDHVFDYEAVWRGNGITTDHIPALCGYVLRHLSRIMQREVAGLEELDALQREIDDHARFGNERSRCFIGRRDVLHTVADYVRGTDGHPLAVFGVSGVGKSALMAQAVQEARREHRDAEVVVRFIGATPGSSDGRALLESLCRQVSRLYGGDEFSVPTTYKELVAEFPKRLALAPPEKPLLVFLDALDQLSRANDACDLAWLPADLPAHVRLIVSALSGAGLETLEHKLPKGNLVPLAPMPVEEGRTLLTLWLQGASPSRTLQAHQRREVLTKFAGCGLPLYLKLAFEAARHWKSYTSAAETVLSPDIPGIIGDLLRWLTAPANHGAVLVSHSLAYLAAAKHGLTEDELLDVLSDDAEVFQDFLLQARHELPERRLPVVVWSRLYFDLEPYLTERSADGASLLTFYHRQLGEVVGRAYLSGDAQRRYHCSLAEYFMAQPLQIDGTDAQTPNSRKVSELPYQCTRGAMWGKLEQVLCDLHFITAKCAAGMTYDLVQDYREALAALPEGQGRWQSQEGRRERTARYVRELVTYAQSWHDARARHTVDPHHHPLPAPAALPCPVPPPTPVIDAGAEGHHGRGETTPEPTRHDHIGAFSQFVRSEADGLLQFASIPGYGIQQAYNASPAGPVFTQAKRLIEQGDVAYALLRRPRTSQSVPAHPACLQKWNGNFYNAAMTYDGALALAAHYDGSIWVWDVATGRCIATLADSGEDAASATALAVTPDGRGALVGRSGAVVQVWDVSAQRCVHRVLTYQEQVNAVAVTPDGRLAVFGGADATVRLWDVATGICLDTLAGHQGKVSAVAVAANGRLAVSAGSDPTLRVWDLTTGACVRTLVGHEGSVNAVAMTPDGRRAVSGGEDATVRVWDLRSGRCVHALTGHTAYVCAVALAPDGRLAVSGGYDRSIRVWDIGQERCLKTFREHTDSVISLCLTADGTTALSSTACDDPTVRLWDIVTGQTAEGSREYHGNVWSIALSRDAHTVASVDKDLRVWDARTGQRLKTLEGSLGTDSRVALTSDDRIAVLAAKGGIRLWDVQTGECRHTLAPSVGYVRDLALTPDGRWAVVAEEFSSRKLSVWDLATGVCEQVIDYPCDMPFYVWVSRDGRLIVSQGYHLRSVADLQGHPHVYGLWELRSGRCVKTWSIDPAASCMSQAARAACADAAVTEIWHLLLRLSRRGLDRKPVALWDGRIGLHADDQLLELLDLESGQRLAVIDLLSTIFSFETGRAVVVAGDRFGDVHFLSVLHRSSGVPRTTAIRLYRFDTGAWDPHPTGLCHWCGGRFVPEARIFDVIRSLTAHPDPRQVPCLTLPDEAFADPRLLAHCAYCHGPLRFDPFVVDNRERP